FSFLLTRRPPISTLFPYTTLFRSLLVERQRPVARDELADVVWGASPPPTWPDALRGVISRVRTVFAAGGIPLDDMVKSDAGCYQLHLPAEAVVDVEAAAAARTAAREALRNGRAPAALDAATEAVSLTGGQFLAGMS